MARKKINWSKVKGDFLLDYMATLEDIAKKHKISYSWIRKKSMKERWFDQKRKLEKEAGKKSSTRIMKMKVKRIVNYCNSTLE